MKKRLLPGINIQHPISRLILSGEKTVETRTYPVPSKYIGRPIALIETPGPSGDFSARVIALVEFGQSFEYQTEREFYADTKRHRVDKSSPWRWATGKPKFGWPVRVIERINPPVAPPKKRGIVFSTECRV